MTHTEFLCRKADAFLERGARIPIDLFYEMIAIGIDVDALERKHMEQHNG